MIYESDYTGHGDLFNVCSLKSPFVFLSPVQTIVTPIEQWNGDIQLVSCDNRGEKITISCSEFPRYTKTSNDVELAVDISNTKVTPECVKQYTSENNNAWIHENTPLLYDMRILDELWRPAWTVSSFYDVWFATSPLAASPFRWHTDSHRFIYVARGHIRVKMAPFYNTPFIKDAKRERGRGEFSSAIDVWTTHPLTERMKFLDFEMNERRVLFVPSYWWYSIQYQTSDTQLFVFTYSTVFNTLANLHHRLT